MEIGDRQVTHAKARDALPEAHLDEIRGDGDRPEESARPDARLIVMDLLARLLVHRTSEEVESDKAEGAVPGFAVHADVQKLTIVRNRAHVRLISRVAVHYGRGCRIQDANLVGMRAR